MNCYFNRCFSHYWPKEVTPPPAVKESSSSNLKNLTEVTPPPKVKESSLSNLKNLTETIFNALSILPCAGLGIASVRATYGLGQASFGNLQQFTGVILGALYGTEKFEERRKAGEKNMLHGYLNMWRGGIDLIAAAGSFSLVEELRLGKEVTPSSVLQATALPVARFAYEMLVRKNPFSPYLKNDSRTDIEEQLKQTEKLMRQYSLIPFAGSLAGLSRLIMGIGQMSVAALNQNIGIIGKVCSSSPRFEDYIARGQKHVLHGNLNITGGMIDTTLSLSGIGSLFLFVWRNDVSAPFFDY